MRSGTRSLLQQGNASALQFISLGKHVGVDMVEIPEGMSYEWVLEELKKHPGGNSAATWGSVVPYLKWYKGIARNIY
jgi:hypothetical protein